MHFKVTPSRIVDATVTVPGDKSISHRSLMLGSIADGETTVSGFLAGEDCLATLAAMRAMGVEIEQPTPTEVVIHGVGLQGLEAPDGPLDLGNSGTAMRLMTGLLAGQSFSATLIGDESLSSRPMQRVIGPLTKMGAEIDSNDGKPPLTTVGGKKLSGITYEMPVASAQVKSSLLLAALYADGPTQIIEPAPTRDHTERMMKAMGAYLYLSDNRVGIQRVRSLKACPVRVPADLSSASFVMLAALLSDDADVVISNVGINPTRVGVIDILQGMGAEIHLERPSLLGGEPVADLRVRASRLRGSHVDPALVPLAIDEFPVLFVAASAAEGTTVFSGLEELRVKESDRIATMASGLKALGIEVEERSDGAVVTGGRFSGGSVKSYGDHRVAMALAIAGTVAGDEVTVRDVAAVDTSFPGFVSCMRSIGANIDVEEDEGSG